MTPNADSDPRRLEALTEAAGRGDRGAIDALLERYRGELHAFIRLRAGPLIERRESSADLVQSVCREILEHADRFQYPSEASFKRWLYTSALRKIKDRHRYYLAGKRDVLKEDVPVDSAENLIEHYRLFSTPSQHMMAREHAARVESAFATLSEEQREVVTLAHLVGLTRSEIADQLGKSEGAVRVILHRALAQLSDLFSESPED